MIKINVLKENIDSNYSSVDSVEELNRLYKNAANRKQIHSKGALKKILIEALDALDGRQLKKFIEPFESDDFQQSDESNDEEGFVSMINSITDRRKKLDTIAEKLLQYM